MSGVFTGMIAGVTCATALILTKRDPFGGMNAGFVALGVNFALTVVVSVIGAGSRRYRVGVAAAGVPS